MAAAYGAPLLGTALVVHFDFPAMGEESAPRLLSRRSIVSGDNYQSGPERYCWQTPRNYFPPRRGEGN